MASCRFIQSISYISIFWRVYDTIKWENTCKMGILGEMKDIENLLHKNNCWKLPKVLRVVNEQEAQRNLTRFSQNKTITKIGYSQDVKGTRQRGQSKTTLRQKHCCTRNAHLASQISQQKSYKPGENGLWIRNTVIMNLLTKVISSNTSFRNKENKAFSG